MSADLNYLNQRFVELFGDGRMPKVYFAPGRVNLIGEHTDYNGGHVFPCTLTMGTYGLVRRRSDGKVLVSSLNMEPVQITELLIEELERKEEVSWTNYVKGVIWALKEHGLLIPGGLEILFWGDIPAGAGLSSSASLEILTGLILREEYGYYALSNTDLAFIGQKAENDYIGMNCGIMDQFASAMGRKNAAIYLDTNDLNYEYAPLNLKEQKLVIVNSGVKHSLVDSAYNERRQQCEQALTDLNQIRKVSTLCSLSQLEYNQMKQVIRDPVCRRRADHAVSENQRTRLAMQSLKRQDMEYFGKLMNQSHLSLQNDYQVSCEEIDFLVETAWKMPGVLGSRITGGGFGGCTINLVRSEKLDFFLDGIVQAYQEEYQKRAVCYQVEAGPGAHIL